MAKGKLYLIPSPLGEGAVADALEGEKLSHKEQKRVREALKKTGEA